MPARGARGSRNHALEMRQEVGVGPGWADGRSDDLATDDIAREDEGAGAVAGDLYGLAIMSQKNVVPATASFAATPSSSR